MSVEVPYTSDEFKDVREKFQASIAKLAGVPESQVSVKSWSSVDRRRRLLAAGVEVDLEIKVDKSTATSTQSKLTMENINTVLKMDGLKEITKISKEPTMSTSAATRLQRAPVLLLGFLLILGSSALTT